MHYADGWAFLDAAHTDYDVVVVDLPDERPDEPNAQHNRLYGVDFLRRAAAVLAPGGVVVGQAGCATLWRNATLRRSVERFAEVFATVVHYGSDEHEWSFLTGSPHSMPDYVEHMICRLGSLHYCPQTLDADALRRGAVLPHALRRPYRPPAGRTGHSRTP
jgi:spermidine synthase